MALAISGIPMLTGDEALAFRERAEETLKKRGSIDFSKQQAFVKESLTRALQEVKLAKLEGKKLPDARDLLKDLEMED